jgi:hypothetical protein
MVQMQRLAATTKRACELAPKSPAHELKLLLPSRTTASPARTSKDAFLFKATPAVITVGWIYSATAQAKCVCQCVNGRTQSIRSSSEDLLPANCPMTKCPTTGPAIVPI